MWEESVEADEESSCAVAEDEVDIERICDCINR